MKTSRCLTLTLTLLLAVSSSAETIPDNLIVNGWVDADGNSISFGTQGASFGGALLYQDTTTDTFTFSTNRNPASWLWLHNAVASGTVAAMRLDSAHQLILYQADGTTAGLTFAPASNSIKLGTHANGTLTADANGVITAGGGFAVAGSFTNTNASATTSFMGNVGIGTASPAASLDVQGTTIFRTGTGQELFRTVWDGGNTGGIASPNGRGLYLSGGSGTASTQGIFLDGAGNVGIGTTSPISKLQVEGDVGLAGGYSAIGNGNYRAIGIPLNAGNWTGAGASIQFWQGGTGGVSNYITFNTHKSGVSAGERIRIDEAGNVGIGTTSPQGTLSVGGSGSLNFNHISYPADYGTRMYPIDSGSGGIFLRIDSQQYTSWTPTVEIGNGANAINPSLRTYHQTYLATASGNVGIGTTAPSQKLEVIGAANVTGVLYASGDALIGNGANRLYLRNLSGTNRIDSYNYPISATVPLQINASTVSFQIADSEKVVINSSGNVGIGTAAPLAKLHVSGGRTYLESADGYGLALFKAGVSSYNYFYTDSSGNMDITDTTGSVAGHVYQSFNQSTKAVTFPTGNVGIGTTSPGALLDVYGSLGSTRVSGNQITHVYNAEANPRWQIDRDAGGSGLAGIKFGAGGVSALDTTIARTSGGGISVTGGNVGIGTSTPTAGLTISTEGSNYTDGSYFLVSGPNSGFGGGATLAGIKTTAADGGDYNFLKIQNAAGTKFVINGAGNVGIGTTSPSARLQIGAATVPVGSALSANFVSTAGTLTGTLGADLNMGSFRFDSTNNNGVALGIHAYRAATGNDWTTSAIGLGMDVDNTTRVGANIWLHASGNVGIGTVSPTAKLAVNGTIRAKEVIVDTGWADYVFDSNYRLAPLAEVEEHIREKKHLPGIPSAAEVAEHGVSMGDMQSKLLSKIEELTLHMIAQEKLMNAQEKRMESYEKENATLRREVSDLKAAQP